ncbi:class I SAM-dependent methyltransferase [Clostridiaceae bacterium HSG29]|nr:class I SAM-dependent methyltransferase [Clostridiaceae bacterium HSG29]
MKSIKENFTVKKQEINYLIDRSGKIKKFKPWLGYLFSFSYDKLMEKSVFPKLLNANINKHFEILKNEFIDIHSLNIIELGTGSGALAEVLPNDNRYVGIDISKGLLKKANYKFKKNNFDNFELYNSSADELPFEDNSFDYAICNLSLNFFDDINLFINELKRVLKTNSIFFCSVPIPERKLEKSKISGTLYSENELNQIFKKYDFDFESKSYENGAILYFTAILKK